MHATHATRATRDMRGFAFESTLGKVARVLTGQYGVTVVFSPDGPRVEPGRIVIPDYELDGGVERDVLIGYLDLLVARAKHAALAELDALPPGVAANLAQVIEDRRVCAQLLDEYPGARWFIGKLREHAAARVGQRWPKLHWRDRLVWLVERALFAAGRTACVARPVRRGAREPLDCAQHRGRAGSGGARAGFIGGRREQHDLHRRPG
jgi:hypothetical protein